ncbi:type VII secretion-associated protein [Rhodococcus sp. NPDC047139]|uniref:type VII secretion-associated protein n=1 Tax=Rhodococcus sp. NPDC047139 TaxID=3155141 RepID=UPI0033E79B74
MNTRDDGTHAVVAVVLAPGSVHIGWAGIARAAPAFTAETPDGRVYGEPARDAPEALDVTAAADAAVLGTEPEVGALLSGLVAYAVAAAGAPAGGAACGVHPTWWNERRRDLFRTAVRQVACDAILLPVAVAAGRAAETAPHERCVVLEFAGRGVAAVVVGSSGAEEVTVERVARDPDLALHDPDAGARLENLLTSVAGGAGPEVVMVTGGPGEPAGVESLALLVDLVGAGRRVVPVAASEMLAAVTGLQRAPAEGEPSSRVSPAAGPAIEDSDRMLPWLTEVRTRPGSARAEWDGRKRTLLVVAATTLVLLAGAALSWPLLGDGRSDRESSNASEVVAEQELPVSPTPSSGSRPVPSQRFDIGPVRLELPEGWRIRDPATAQSGRAELIPAGGADRRIVLVYRELGEGVDERSVASALAARAAERAPVIRDLDTDTTFADRKVVAYNEVPEDFSVVRWSVLVFPGLQVSLGCQYLDGEWSRIRSECEQAVHTLRIG